MPELILHFHKPADWADTVYIHYWNSHPHNQATDWPGVPMVAEGDDWFSYRLAGVQSANLVFNDQHSAQTGDLWCEKSGYYANSQWHDSQAAAESSVTATHHAAPASHPAPAPTPSTRYPVTPTGKDFREETIYFLLTARFYEGDPSISFFCRDRLKFNRETGQPEDPHWRGDFKGL
ncbi:MAG: starch-binding protein, partial [Candidatus Competibacter denitrificans]